ncbi:hypothetical protein AB0J47_42140 [Nocardia sp. NPDC049737]|uniref:hypothetical protein n=1 Tax=Nocardia sp. NPDC049737 TaxID=3154358 RepID=UPI00343BFCEF
MTTRQRADRADRSEFRRSMFAAYDVLIGRLEQLGESDTAELAKALQRACQLLIDQDDSRAWHAKQLRTLTAQARTATEE